jgi:hypothetical protein
VLGLIDDFDRNRFMILLRQLSLPPGLVDDDHDAVPCAKLGALVEQLGDIVGGGHRAFVFSGVMDEGDLFASFSPSATTNRLW